MNPERPHALPLESTGDPSFDAILGGGIPAQSVIVVAGEPGSGKSVLALQMLFHAARQGRKALYLTTLSEPALKIIRYMQLFEFFDEHLLDRQVIFVDLGTEIRGGADRALTALAGLVEEHEPGLVVIDSFRAIGDLFGEGSVTRSFVYDLSVQMAGWGATTLLVGEYVPEEYSRYPEFAVADGIFRLGAMKQELTSVREIEVLKLRAMNYVPGRHFFEISDRGVAVYPRVRAPEVTGLPLTASNERVSTGIDGLDELLGGGLPSGSNAVLQGGTGTGKTALGLRFVVAGASQGERSVFFTLEETPDQLRKMAGGLGWDLPALERAGLVQLQYTSPVELSTDRYLQTVRAEVERLGAARAVFDSLTAMALGVPSERRFKELVYAVGKYMHLGGVTFLMTMESQQLLGAEEISGHGISFSADNLIQLRYVEIDGRLERGISVLKVRGAAHSTELRLLKIARGGPEVVAAEDVPLRRGVLTGHLPPAAKRARTGKR